MRSNFRLLMISAMYENGGNTTQRLLDGHPELFSYPFESQPGTQARRRPPHQHVPGEVPLAGLPAFGRRPSRTTRRSSTRSARSASRRRSRASSATTRSSSTTGDRKAAFVDAMAGKERTRANLDRGVLPGVGRGVEGLRTARAARRSTSATARSSSSTPTRSSPTCPAGTSCTSCATRGRPTPTPRSGRCRSRSPTT